MDVWNYILGYRNTLKSVFETWVVHIPFKGIRKAKMHFYRISDSLKNTFSVAVDLQNEFYIINACIICQFLL